MELPPLPPLDPAMSIPYDSIRFVPGYAEVHVHEWMRSYAEQAVLAERERCARVCESLRDEHCAAMEASSEPEEACKRDGSCGCDFVAAWNDAAEAIRGE